MNSPGFVMTHGSALLPLSAVTAQHPSEDTEGASRPSHPGSSAPAPRPCRASLMVGGSLQKSSKN